MTPFERVVGDSSKDHMVTAPTFTTRPTTEQLHHYAGRHCRTTSLLPPPWVRWPPEHSMLVQVTAIAIVVTIYFGSFRTE